MTISDRVAIVNGFGLSLGDSIIGLQALTAAQALGHLPPRVTLIRRTDCRPMVRALYRFVADFADIVDLPDELSATPPPPLPATLTERFAQVIDMRDFAFDADFRGVAMIDFFLRRLGLDPLHVPPTLCRNAWLAQHVPPQRVAGLPERYILFCPNASMPQRDIPPDAQRRLLERLLETQPYAIVTQAEVPPGLSGRVLAAPFLTQVEELCGLVRHAAGLVSTDTAMPHLADAWHVPTHTVFTTHRPHWRVRDYPHCTATHLQGHGLPEALEFIRSEADLHAVAAAWQAGIGALEAEIDRFVAGL